MITLTLPQPDAAPQNPKGAKGPSSSNPLDKGPEGHGPRGASTDAKPAEGTPEKLPVEKQKTKPVEKQTKGGEAHQSRHPKMRVARCV